MNGILQIDNQFMDLLPQLTSEEFTELEKLIIKDGCTESIKVWCDPMSNITYIIDGHNRYGICTKYDIPFAVTEMEFNDREDVLDWIIKHQFARRNITDAQKAYLRGLQYENEKKKQGGNGSNQYSSKGEESSHLLNTENEKNTTVEPPQSNSTAERLGKEHQVSGRVIKDDGKFAKALDLIADTIGVEVKFKILNKEKLISKADIIAIGKQIDNGTADIEGLRKVLLSEDKKVDLSGLIKRDRSSRTPRNSTSTPEPVEQDSQLEPESSSEPPVEPSPSEEESEELNSEPEPDTSPTPTLKVCTKCQEEKSVDYFYANHNECKECEIKTSVKEPSPKTKGQCEEEKHVEVELTNQI